MMFLPLLIGAVSAALYLRRRAWTEAALVLLAALALAGLLARWTQPAASAGALRVTAATPAAEVAAASSLTVDGDGLTAAEWRDLPARPLQWQAPATPVFTLAFPRATPLGRSLRVSLKRGAPGEARLQLLAENGQMLAETRGKDAELSVEWLPPVAEDLVLRARLLDVAGKVLAEGPVPVRVQAALALQAKGRLYAPSFDAQALNRLLSDSGANTEWEVTLGKDIRRSETPKSSERAPELLLVDAAWFEHAAPNQRQAMLDQAGQGASLVVLGSNANEAGVWANTLQLSLRPQSATEINSGGMALVPAALAPIAGGAWTAVDAGIVARDWKQGRIVWIGVADWHRHAIAEPQALGRWWQNVLDAAHVKRQTDVQWLAPASMPLVGQRTEICALGVEGPSWQARQDQIDARCLAVWPKQAGWMDMEGRHRVYVFATNDWPQWQAAERREATRRYQERTPVVAKEGTRPWPAWPFALAFALAVFGLWWRERR